jgi:hypothetical protein
MIADINFDSNKDILLYSNSSKKICVIEEDEQSKYSRTKIIRPTNTLSHVLPIFNGKTHSPLYAFVSRQQRSVGLFELSKYGRFKLVSRLTFESYPGNMKAADINYDGKMEFLISGSAFDGLSIISFDNEELREEKLEENSSYGEAIFADISNDNSKDIVAFNLMNHQLEMFFNDGLGDFSKTRSLDFKNGINDLNAVDVNRDRYVDLIYCNNHSINIIWGDFESAYDSTSFLETNYIPDKYLVYDYNNDGLNDIAYIDSSQGLLSIFFGKDHREFYSEVLYLKRNGLVDFHIIDEEEKSKLVLLNRNGEIYTISKISSVDEEITLVPAIQPGAVSTFNSGNDSILDYCFIDNFSQSLNFFINNDSKIPSYYFTLPLSEKYDRIVVNDKHSSEKGFYCFSPNQNMLEIINCDFNSYNYEVNQLYIPGSMKDVKINNTTELVQVYVAFEEENLFRINEYEHHNFRYNVREYYGFDPNIIAPIQSVREDPIIYYWIADDDSLFQYKLNIQLNLNAKERLGSVSRSEISGDASIIQSVIGDERLNINSLLISGKNLFSVVTDDNSFNISDPILNKYDFKSIDTKNLKFNRVSDQMYNSVFYSSSNHKFNRIKININDNKLTFRELFEAKDVVDYTGQRISSNVELLLYTQTAEGKLSLKLLK